MPFQKAHDFVKTSDWRWYDVVTFLQMKIGLAAKLIPAGIWLDSTSFLVIYPLGLIFLKMCSHFDMNRPLNFFSENETRKCLLSWKAKERLMCFLDLIFAINYTEPGHSISYGITCLPSNDYNHRCPPPLPRIPPHTPPGRVAQSVGHLTRKSEVLASIPGQATYFRFSFRWFKQLSVTGESMCTKYWLTA